MIYNQDVTKHRQDTQKTIVKSLSQAVQETCLQRPTPVSVFPFFKLTVERLLRMQEALWWVLISGGHHQNISCHCDEKALPPRLIPI